MNAKYFFGSILAIPLLPLMYLQGKRIRSKVPSLPEAKGKEGVILAGTTNKLRILAIGESTVAGVGVETHEEGFAGSMAKELSSKLNVDVEWKVYAKSGYTAKKVVEKIIPRIQETNIDVIVIGLGGNDAFTLNNPKKWKAHIQELINALKSKFKNVIIVFANMPPIKEFPAFTSLIKITLGNLVEILGEELELLIKDQKDVFYYSRTITIESWIKRLNIKAKPSAFFSDGVHPSKLTYQVWAKDFSNFIIEQKEIKTNLKHRLNL